MKKFVVNEKSHKEESKVVQSIAEKGKLEHHKNLKQRFISSNSNYKDSFKLKEEGNFFVSEGKSLKGKFAKYLVDKELVKLSHNHHEIVLGLKSNTSKRRYNSNVRILDNQTNKSSLIYEELERGVDLKYEIFQEGLKESIIIKEKQDIYEYEFTLSIGDLTPTFNEKENTLELKKEGKTIYRVLTPFMVDGNKNYSNDCSYEIEDTGKGFLNIILKANKEWANSRERVFPITVDPTIVAVRDEIIEILPLTNGNTGVTLDRRFALGVVNFTYGFPIFYAVKITLKTNVINSSQHDKIYLKLPLESFGEDMTISDRLVAFTDSKILKIFTPFTQCKSGLVLDITDFIKTKSGDVILYVSSTLDPNFSIVAAQNYPDVLPRKTEAPFVSKNEVYFYSAIDNEDEVKPQIVIETYEEDIDQDLSKDYSIGRSGVTLINLKIGSYKHEHNDHAYVSHNALSLSLYHVYNSKDSTDNSAFLGKGWKTNFHQTLEKSEAFNQLLGSKEITYTDGQGKKHLLHEHWYYLDENKVKHYVKREEIYLDSDQKLKYKNGDTHIYEVKLDIKSDDGLLYVTGNTENIPSIQKGDIEISDYYIIYGDGSKEILIEKKGLLTVPKFYFINTAKKRAYITSESVESGSSLVLFGSESTPVYRENLQCRITINEENKNCVEYMIPSPVEDNKEYPIRQMVYANSNINFKPVPLEDIYFNEQIIKIDNEIESHNEYIKGLKKTLLDYGYTLSEIEISIINNETIKDLYAVSEESLSNIESTKMRFSEEATERQKSFYNEKYSECLDEINKTLTKIDELNKTSKYLTDTQRQSVNDFIIDKDGNNLGFDGYGRLIFIQDKYENKIEIKFGYEDEDEGKMVSIYSETQTVRFNYDRTSGLLSSIIDPQGRKTRYSYLNGNLVSITYNDKQKTRFDYEEFSAISPNLDKTTIEKLSNGNIIVRQYCYDGRISQDTVLNEEKELKKIVDHHYTFDVDNETTTVTDDRTKKAVTYHFDHLGRVIKQFDEDNTSVTFYEQGRIKSQVRYKTDKQKSVLDHLTIHDGAWSYQLILNRYENLPISNMVGLKLDVLTTDVTNDSVLSFKVKALVNSTTPDGGMKSEVFEQEYQELKLQTVVLPIVIDRHLTSQIDIVIESSSSDFTSSYLDGVELIALEEGEIYQYDNKERLIREQNGYTIGEYTDFNEDDIPLSRTERNIYNEEIITHFSYNANKKVTLIEDSKGNIIEYYYDLKGNCLEKRSYNKKDSSLMKVEKATYDEQGRVIDKASPIKDDEGKETKTSVSYIPGTENERKVRRPNGDSITYAYDYNNGEMLSISSSVSGINNSTSFNYNYGLLTSMSHHGVKVSYTYDGLGRKTKITLNDEEVMWNQYVDEYNSDGDLNYSFSRKIEQGSYQDSTTLDGLFSASYYNDKSQLLYTKYSGNESLGETSCFYDEDKVGSITSSITYRENDHVYKEESQNSYNEYHQLIKQEKKVNDLSQVVLEDHYDVTNRFVMSSDVILSESDYRLNYLNEYDEEHRLTSVVVREGLIGDEGFFTEMEKASFKYDVLNRVTHSDISTEQMSLCHEYTYLQQDERTLDLIAEDITKIKVKNGSKTTYLSETTTINMT